MGGGAEAGRRGTAVGDRRVGKIQGGCSGIRGRRLLWTSEGSHLVLLPSPFSTSTTKIPSRSQFLHFPAAPSRVHRTWSFRSCRPCHCVCPSSCHFSSRGRHTSPHATPQDSTGGAKQVYQCQVEGCKEGPSTSGAIISAHVQKVHLGVRLVCPFCNKTFFNPDVLRHHRKAHD